MRWNDTDKRTVEESPAPIPEAASLPRIPDGASDIIVAWVTQSQAARAQVQQVVALTLATLGLSLETHDIAIEDGRAVVVERPA